MFDEHRERDKWLAQAVYDFDTAKEMHKVERYLYVLFCCQQSVEKALKGVIVHRTKTFPQKSHNLLQLSKDAGIEWGDDDLLFIRELNSCYIVSRYPEDLRHIEEKATNEVAMETLQYTERILSWLRSTLK